MAVFVQAKKLKIKQCDIQYLSNDAEKSALITGINYISKYTKNRKQLF